MTKIKSRDDIRSAEFTARIHRGVPEWATAAGPFIHVDVAAKMEAENPGSTKDYWIYESYEVLVTDDMKAKDLEIETLKEKIREMVAFIESNNVKTSALHKRLDKLIERLEAAEARIELLSLGGDDEPF